MDTLYRKIKTDKGSTRYVPVYTTGDVLPDGIWYIRTRPGVRGITNVGYIADLLKVGDAKYIDLGEMCGLHALAEMIEHQEEFRNVTSKSCSLDDVVHVVLGILARYKKEGDQLDDKMS